MKIILNNIFHQKVFEETEKEVIILKNVFFDMKRFDCKEKIHFLIDKNGVIYQLVDPGLSLVDIDKKNIDRKSIFIGLFNEGALTKRNDEKFYFRNKFYIEYKEPVFISEEKEEEKYFATYKESQLASLMNLLNYLFDKYPKVDKFFSNSFDYNEKWFNTRGIILKRNVEKSNQELTLAFPIERFNRYIMKLSREEIMNMVKVLLVELIPYKEFKNNKKRVKSNF